MAKPKSVAPKKKATKSTKKKATVEGIYDVTLLVNNDTEYNSQSEVLADAIFALKPTIQVKSKATLTVKVGDKTFTRSYMPKNIKRALINYQSAQILAKQISYLL